MFWYAIGSILVCGLVASGFIMLFGAESHEGEEPDSESAEFSASSTEDGEIKENLQP